MHGGIARVAAACCLFLQAWHVAAAVEDSKTKVAKSLADDPSFKKPDYADNIAQDPRCEKAEDWHAFRLELLATSPEDAGALSLSFMFDYLLANATMMDGLDAASSRCFMGVVTALYSIAFQKLTAKTVDGAAFFFKTLDQYLASLHPLKVDQAAGYGAWWPITDGLVAALRRAILRESANSTKGTAIKPTSGKVPGNAFQVVPEDLVDGIPLSQSAKVFVYEVDDYVPLQKLAAGPSFCRENQWGFEVLLHDWFLACPCRTDNPEEADFFFVPHYTACHLNVESFTEEESAKLFERLISELRFFNRTGGADHIFVWGSGMGADGPFRSWRSYIANSLFLMTETELWNPYEDINVSSYTPWKDIVLPGRLTLKEIAGSHTLSTIPIADRPFLAEFVGWWRPLHKAQGYEKSPRGAILNWAGISKGQKDRKELEENGLFIKQDVPYSQAYTGSTHARFCLVPRGKSAWSSRFFRVLFAGCVPVLLNDYYEPPFESFLNVPDWLIKWPMRRVDEGLLDFLASLKPEVVEKMVERLNRDRCWYLWPPSALDFEQVDLQKGKLDGPCPNWRTQNAFFGVMSLLNKKRRKSKTSFSTFYLPVGSTGRPYFVDEKLQSVMR